MTRGSKEELVLALRQRYHRARLEEQTTILDELCATAGYHPKYAVSLLNRPEDEQGQPKHRKRRPMYTDREIGVLAKIWEAGTAVARRGRRATCARCGPAASPTPRPD